MTAVTWPRVMARLVTPPLNTEKKTTGSWDTALTLESRYPLVQELSEEQDSLKAAGMFLGNSLHRAFQHKLSPGRGTEGKLKGAPRLLLLHREGWEDVSSPHVTFPRLCLTVFPNGNASLHLGQFLVISVSSWLN